MKQEKEEKTKNKQIQNFKLKIIIIKKKRMNGDFVNTKKNV